MTYDELIAALRDRNALIVHFSHHAEMDHSHVYPQDLKEAIANSRKWSLSCSVIWPERCISVGSIGIILRPSTLASIESVMDYDAGSYALPDGSRVSGGLPLTDETFEATFNAQHSKYNEWTITDSHTVGIFVMPNEPPHVKVLSPPQEYEDIAFEALIGLVNVSLGKL